MDVSMNDFIVALFLQAHDIQILSTDDIISVDIHPGELMEEIGPLVIDPFIGLVQLIHEFSAVIGAFLSSGKLSLDILDLCSSLLCELGFSTEFPSLSTTKDVKPTSRPTTLPVSDNCFGSCSA